MVNAKINEAVSKSADDFLLTPEEAYTIVFQKLVEVEGKNKYARASFDVGHKQFMEICEKYGFTAHLQKKWAIYDSTTKKNVPFKVS